MDRKKNKTVKIFLNLQLATHYSGLKTLCIIWNQMQNQYFFILQK